MSSIRWGNAGTGNAYRSFAVSVRPWFMVCVASIGMVALNGCSNKANKWVQRRPRTFPASGLVTLDGSVIENALVSFDSLEHNLTAVGRTDKSGKFILKTFEPNDGAVVGEHRVQISKIEATGYDSEDRPIALVNRLPQRYAELSGQLRATVDPDSDNVFRFELTTGKPVAQ